MDKQPNKNLCAIAKKKNESKSKQKQTMINEERRMSTEKRQRSISSMVTIVQPNVHSKFRTEDRCCCANSWESRTTARIL